MKCSRRIRPIVSTVSIPPTARFESQRAAHRPTFRGSILDADPPAQGVKIARRNTYISPAIDQLAFNCPHCNTLAKQFWFSVHADPLKADVKPVVATAETVKTVTFSNGNLEEAERDRKLKWAEQMASGRPFLEVHREFRNRDVQNVSISYCFNCNEMCLWVYDQLVWPARAGGSEAKPLAPPNVRCEYEEAN